VSDFDPVPMARLVVLFAVVAFKVIATATAFASVVNVARAATQASARVEKVDGTALLGAAGSAVMVMVNPPYK